MVGLWWMWIWCNEATLLQKTIDVDFKVQWIKAKSIEIKNAFDHVLGPKRKRNRYKTKLVKWNKPPIQWKKLNTDGCYKS